MMIGLNGGVLNGGYWLEECLMLALLNAGAEWRWITRTGIYCDAFGCTMYVFKCSTSSSTIFHYLSQTISSPLLAFTFSSPRALKMENFHHSIPQVYRLTTRLESQFGPSQQSFRGTDVIYLPKPSRFSVIWQIPALNPLIGV